MYPLDSAHAAQPRLGACSYALPSDGVGGVESGVPLDGLGEHPRGGNQRAEFREVPGPERRDQALRVGDRLGAFENQDDVGVAEERLVSREPVLCEVEWRTWRISCFSSSCFPGRIWAMTAI